MSLIPSTKKVNYLNNRDILKEIHKSKTTYCAFIDRTTDSQYDAIVADLSKVNKARIKEAREAKIDRHKRETGVVLKPSQIPITDLVFRLMTWAHIPMVPKKPTKAQIKQRAKLEEIFDDVTDDDREEEDYGISDEVHQKVNFPPFQHYKLKEDAETLYLVGKSHWEGDLDSGHFSKDHGAMTPKLAHMFIKLCERYATRSNWRGYTYNEEMRGQALLQLSQIGLQFDESKSSNPFAYYTAAITNSFTRVLNIEKKMQNIRDDILEMNGLNPSWTRQNSGVNPNDPRSSGKVTIISPNDAVSPESNV
ncbi:MAG: hypothetical protein H0Z55_03660 [Nitrosarchaeum sp.]|nr:hypothetical protein [Nitrosarchaeum sp.]